MQQEVATLAGGCFWCLEAVFERLAGVQKVVSGYMGGKVDHPTYKDVCSGRTGHAEVVQVHFDASKIAFDDLLEVFFAIHDPTTSERSTARRSFSTHPSRNRLRDVICRVWLGWANSRRPL